MASIYAIETIFPDGDMLTPELMHSIHELPIDREIVLDIAHRNRLDIVSYKYYNTVELWWLIGIYNDIQDATNMGDSILKLKLPRLADITSLLNEYVGGLS